MKNLDNMLKECISGDRGFYYYQIPMTETFEIHGGYFFHKSEAIFHLRQKLYSHFTSKEIAKEFLRMKLEEIAREVNPTQ